VPPSYGAGCLTQAQRDAYSNECEFTNLRGLGATASRAACGYRELPVCSPEPPMPAPLPPKPSKPKLSPLPSKPAVLAVPKEPKSPGAAPPPPKLVTVPAAKYPPPPPKPGITPDSPPPLPPPPVYVEEQGGGNFAVMGILGIVAVAGAGYLIFRKKQPKAA
jgi:hypothetical protein